MKTIDFKSLAHNFELGFKASHTDDYTENSLRKIYSGALTKAAEIIEHWKQCHEGRLRIFPDNECIKCEINDCAELKRHIESFRDSLNKGEEKR